MTSSRKLLARLVATGRAPATALPARRPSNAHAALCARKGDRKAACTCGATKRTHALEDSLLAQLAEFGVRLESGRVERDAEYLPPRKFRGDLVFYAARLVVEVQGWRSGFGPHGGISKANADVDKHSLSAANGWRVLPVTAGTIRDGSAAARIALALLWRPEEERT